MPIIIGFGIIMLFYALGEGLSILTHHFIPGSVYGMILLFAALCLKIVKPGRIEQVAHYLTGNMTLFFIPAITAIIDQWGILQSSWLSWLAVIVVSTIVVMASCGYTMQAAQWLARRKGGRS